MSLEGHTVIRIQERVVLSNRFELQTALNLRDIKIDHIGGIGEVLNYVVDKNSRVIE